MPTGIRRLKYGIHADVHTLAACMFVLHIGLTGWCGRRWNKLGESMAGAKKRRKIKLLTAVYRTSWST